MGCIELMAARLTTCALLGSERLFSRAGQFRRSGIDRRLEARQHFTVAVHKILGEVPCRNGAQRIKEMPEGFTAFKNNIDPLLGCQRPDSRPRSRPNNSATWRGYANCREAVGDDIDIAVHCHNELDTPSAIAVAKVVEPMNPLFIEDGSIPRSPRRGWHCATLRACR